MILLSFQACSSSKGDGEAGSQEPFDVGAGVARYWCAAEPRVGALHDTSTW